MKTTLCKSNTSIRIVVKIAIGCTKKFRFAEMNCSEPLSAVLWLKDFARIHNFDIFDAFCDYSNFRFYTLIDGKFAKLPNEEVFDIINGKLA